MIAAGILHILLLCPSTVISSEYRPDIVETIMWLVSLQDKDGNWPSKAPPNESANELVQPVSHFLSTWLKAKISIFPCRWCHGAPGVLIMLSTCMKKESTWLDSDQRDLITVALRRGAALTYGRGFLRKGVGLCHGVAGSIYALLAASDVLDTEEEHVNLFRAAHLAQLAIPYREMTTRGELRLPDRPLSLYEGVAGMCCALGELIERLRAVGSKVRPRARGMPGFDDL